MENNHHELIKTLYQNTPIGSAFIILGRLRSVLGDFHPLPASLFLRLIRRYSARQGKNTLLCVSSRLGPTDFLISLVCAYHTDTLLRDWKAESGPPLIRRGVLSYFVWPVAWANSGSPWRKVALIVACFHRVITSNSAPAFNFPRSKNNGHYGRDESKSQVLFASITALAKLHDKRPLFVF